MYLIEKSRSDNRTATKLGEKFYYIVPETQYTQSELAQICKRPYQAVELDQYRSAIEDGEKKQKD